MENTTENPIYSKPLIHGFYSKKQIQKSNQCILYLNINNETVRVTEVSIGQKGDHDKRFSDSIYLGILNKWISTSTTKN